MKSYGHFVMIAEFFLKKKFPGGGGVGGLAVSNQLRWHHERDLIVENASFTPMVFSANGGMGKECKKYYSRLAEMIAEKRGIAVSDASTFFRTRISFPLLRSALLCIRGSRSTKPMTEFSEVDIQVANFEAKI